MVYSNQHQFLDRRENPRINWINSEVQVIIMPSNSKSKVCGWIQDISQGGFKVKAEISPKIMGSIQKWEEIHFETFEDFFQLRGKEGLCGPPPMRIWLELGSINFMKKAENSSTGFWVRCL